MTFFLITGLILSVVLGGAFSDTDEMRPTFAKDSQPRAEVHVQQIPDSFSALIGVETENNIPVRTEPEMPGDTYQVSSTPDGEHSGELQGQDAPEPQGEKENAPAPTIAGVGTIRLEPEQLARLGLYADTAGVWTFTRVHGRGEGKLVSMWGTLFNENAPQYRERSEGAPMFQPVFVTDDLGNKRMEVLDEEARRVQEQEAEQELSKKEALAEGEMSEEERALFLQNVQNRISDRRLATGNFVPVLVRTGREYTPEDNADRRWRPDCIMWFEPTKEFLAALPEAVRTALQRELYLVALLQSKPEDEPVSTFMGRQSDESRETFDSLVGSQNGEQNVSVVAGDSYTDSWRSVSGAITSSSIVPNPAQDILNVHYRLSANHTVTFGLYDVNGKLIQVLSESQSRSGENLVRLELQDISAGIYLLAITTDAGDRAVQRVIVE